MYGNKNSNYYKAISNSNRRIFANLGYTAAIKLLSVPEGEIENFIKKTEIEKITVDKLNDCIKEYKKEEHGNKLKKNNKTSHTVIVLKNNKEDVIKKIEEIKKEIFISKDKELLILELKKIIKEFE